jgi:hypothetical protein
MTAGAEPAPAPTPRTRIAGRRGPGTVPPTAAAEPVMSEPVMSEPVMSEPVMSEPVMSECGSCGSPVPDGPRGGYACDCGHVVEPSADVRARWERTASRLQSRRRSVRQPRAPAPGWRP